MEEETLYFIAEKLAYRPKLAYRRHTIREKAAFDVLSQRYLRAGRTNHRKIRIM